MQKLWWKQAKIYELYVDKFAGNFVGLTARLPYFNALGINTLHILPHYPSGGVDDGYDITDYRAVRDDLGTLRDFEAFVSAAHALGIRVITDLVLNHTSDRHPWFIEARASKENPKRNYYLWNEKGEGFAEAPNMFPHLKPHNWIPNDETRDYYFATFYPQQPDLNWDNEAVFDEMLSIMEFWAQKGVDGFRLDAAAHLVKREGTNSTGLPESHAVVRKLRAVLEKKYPEVVFLAESTSDPRPYLQSDECHMAYDFPLMRQLWLTLMDQDHASLDSLVASSRDVPENCQWATFLRNHDEISLRNLPDADYVALQKFLDPEAKYMCDGYPAVRVAEVFNGDVEKIIGAFELLYSLPGAPIMYYGDEIGLRNLPRDAGLIDMRKCVRNDFDWKEAERQMADPNSLWNRTAALIKRTAVPTTQEGEAAPVA